MRRLSVLLLGLGLTISALPAIAARLTCPGGQFDDNRATAGNSANFVDPTGYNTIWIQAIIRSPGGTDALTVIPEVCCGEGCTDSSSGDWVQIDNGGAFTMPIAITTLENDLRRLDNPGCPIRIRYASPGDTPLVDTYFRCGSTLR